MSAEAPQKPELPCEEARHKVDVTEEGEIAKTDKETDSGRTTGAPPPVKKNGAKSMAKTPAVKTPVASSPSGNQKEKAASSQPAVADKAETSELNKSAVKDPEKKEVKEPEKKAVKPSLAPFGSVMTVSSDNEGTADASEASPQATLASEDLTGQASREGRETADSAGAYFTAKGGDDLDDVGLDLEPEDAKRLEDDFEEVTVDDIDGESPTASKQATNGESPSFSKQATHTTAPSVTSEEKPAAQKSSSSPPQAIQDGQRSQSIAKDLADAEAEAESLARNGKPAKNQPPAIDLPGDETAFEEEQLKSAEKPAVPLRPMSPAPAPISPPPPQTNFQPVSEPDEYKGLVYYDGVDSLGRPVVIVNADALPRSASRKAAVQYLLQRLEPIVTQGPYVCVFLSTGENSKKNRLPAGWLASCYREMSYPFKKNVKHVILVRPSFTLRVMLTLMYPLLSKKAMVKIRKIEKLSALETATNGEVTLQHLGPRFNTIAAKSIIAAEGPGFVQDSAYQMPNL